MHVFVLSCKFVTSKHKNMHISMYFLHLVLVFTPHYIITDKGLLGHLSINSKLYDENRSLLQEEESSMREAEAFKSFAATNLPIQEQSEVRVVPNVGSVALRGLTV